MCSDAVIRANGLSKRFEIYDKPQDRLRQFVFPRIQRLFARPQKCFYREFWALRDINFEIAKGQTVGIVGRNGSGKSTLLQLICGTLNPTEGEVATSGRVAALLELGSGFNPEFSGYENVFMNAAILGLSAAETDAKFDAIAAFADIGEFIHQPVKTYSSGMFARLAFAIAINVDPEILIVDEALAVGDARFVSRCMRKIKDLQNEGTSILFVSHDIGSVRTLCDSAIWLENGRLVEHGDVFPITGRYTEYLFKDDTETGLEKSVQRDKKTETEKLEEPPLNQTDASGETHSTAPQPANSDVLSKKKPESIDASPITHWGSHQGLVQKAFICDHTGNKADVIHWGQTVQVRIKLQIPLEIPRENLSIAFSIKDLKGTDLIVSTTRDTSLLQLPVIDAFEISFSFTNPLVEGRYLLVAAVEDRTYRDIHYYEYVEGIQYFASMSDRRLFGLFHPLIEQKVSMQNDD